MRLLAPETRNMVQFDPVFNSVAAGALVTGALVNAPALLQTNFTSTSLISGGADYIAQMAFKEGNIGEWNITQTLATAFCKLPFTQSTLGSALDLRPNNIFTSDKKLFGNTIFGQKDTFTFINESFIGGVFNKIGEQSIMNSNSFKGVSKTMMEVHNLMVSYMMSNYLSDAFQKNIPTNSEKKK